MAHLLRIDQANAKRVQATSMAAEQLTETAHLEQWIATHPGVIDDDLKVVTTQFNRWASSGGGTAREALDVLALSSSGQTVVIELKRDSDRKVHLQAITYGALVAGFDRKMLAEVHAEWLRKSGQEVSALDALAALTDHLESDWDDEILKLPKLVMVAERFPDQVLTTVEWLTTTVADGLEIECHEYTIFRDGQNSYASFQQRFPVEDIDGRRLRPVGTVDAGEVKERIASRKKRSRSVKLISDHQHIPNGAQIDLDVTSLVKPEVVQDLNVWLDEDPRRREVSWVTDPSKPLRWAFHENPHKQWTLTALRNLIFEEAGLNRGSFSAGDAWCYQGRSMYWIAEDLNAEDSDTETAAELGGS